jgi:hypothetical protein
MGNVRRPSKRHGVTSRQPAYRVRSKVLWSGARCVTAVDLATWDSGSIWTYARVC